MNLADLNIASELIPFFDNSLNRHSREALSALFNNIPKTRGEALERQQVLVAFTASLHKIKNLHSYNADIEEAYAFCCQLEGRLPVTENNLNWLQLKLLFSGKETDRLLSRSIQLLLLFEKIYTNYLAGLNMDLFPAGYKQSIRQLVHVVTLFEKERAILIEKGNDLSVRGIARLMHKLFGVYKSGHLLQCWKAFFEFEAYLSIAVTARAAALVPAQFIDEGIHITGLFHPFIKDPVRNSLTINKNVLVLTGPNMSGKSTLLRSVSLCVFLARLGFPVPASECRVFFADEIDVFINSRDNLTNGYSHFMMEVLHLKQSILAAQEGKKVFAVFDELFNGTNVDDALNILTITISGLGKFPGACFLLSTHIYKLKERSVDEMKHAGFYYIDSFIENGVPAFTYQLKKGWSQMKFGTLLFEKEGLMQLLE